MRTKNSDKSFITSILTTLLKFGAAALVIYLLFRGDSEKIRRGLQTFNYLWLIPAAALYILHTLVAAWRWRQLAGVQGIKMRFIEAYSLTMQGYFFSLMLPGGAVGGDIVKMSAVSGRLSGGGRTEGIFSILTDRVIGMIALFFMALLLIIPTHGIFVRLAIPGVPEKISGNLFFWLIFAVCTAGICAGTAMFFHRFFAKISGVNTLIRFADRHTGGRITRLINAADLYRNDKKLLFKTLLASIAGVHLPTALPILFLLAGCGGSFDILNAVTALTIGNIAGLLPLFPGGIGGRDAVSIALLTAGGAANAHADSAQILYTALMSLISLAGGLFFIFDPGRKLHYSGVAE